MLHPFASYWVPLLQKGRATSELNMSALGPLFAMLLKDQQHMLSHGPLPDVNCQVLLRMRVLHIMLPFPQPEKRFRMHDMLMT